MDDDDDDLEQLLDEVEQKFCRNVSVTSSGRADTDNHSRSDHGRPPPPPPPPRRTSQPQQVNSTLAADIDALLEELLEEDDSVCQTPKLPRGAQVEKKPSSQCGGRKCCPVFVGGSSNPNGVGTSASKRSCDQLRCTSCDFRVLTFDDCEWDSSCDYLFFRNNVPEVEKLRAKLRRRSGVRAYACQCSWLSTRELSDLREQSRLRWVCGKHPEG